MRDLARDLFTHLGAHIQPGDDGELIVDLPPDLADQFGKPRLHLAFASAELSPYEDLVAYGSRTFETMLHLLEGNQRVYGALPARHTIQPEAPPHELVFPRAQVTVQGQPSWPLVALFHFRLTYTADERREEIWPVALRLDAWPFPCHVEESQVAQSLVARPELAPTVDELAHVAQSAFERACEHADEVGAAFEREIKPRVHKTVLRLASFYRRQIDALDEPDATRASLLREELQADLQRKISDELARNQLQVQVRPVTLALIEWPVWRYHLSLNHRRGSLDLIVERELFTGQLLGWPSAPPTHLGATLPWSGRLRQYQWQTILAPPHTLYVGRRRLGYAAIVVDADDTLLYAERLGWPGSLRQRLSAPS